jgi:hypothetical protein
MTRAFVQKARGGVFLFFDGARPGQVFGLAGTSDNLGLSTTESFLKTSVGRDFFGRPLNSTFPLTFVKVFVFGEST